MRNIWMEIKTHQGFVILGSSFIDLLLQVGLLTYFKTHLSFVLNDFSHSVQSWFLLLLTKHCLWVDFLRNVMDILIGMQRETVPF